jgi:RNA polymerase sigma-70 factor (ECF subfamily)
MLTAGKVGTFERGRAEVPHQAGAIALTEPREEADGSLFLAHHDMEADEPTNRVDALVTRAKAGDGAAFDELLGSLRPRAMAAALRVLHNPDDAEDAVQETFLKIWRALPTFEGRSSFPTWLHRIVTNTSLDLLRKTAARPETVERVERQDDLPVAAVEPACIETPESALRSREIERMVRLAVAGLPPAQRQTVVLREFEDCSYQEIAEITECPIGTVMSRLHHARNKLADDLRAS